METRSHSFGTTVHRLRSDSRAFLAAHSVFRKTVLVLLLLAAGARFVLFVAEGIRPSASQERKRIVEEQTKDAQFELQKTHLISGFLLDSIANDGLINFYVQYSSPSASEAFLRNWASQWLKQFSQTDAESRKRADADLSMALYDVNGRLRARYIPALNSPAPDTLFASGAILDRRSRLSEVDSTTQLLCYSTYRRLFSKQGMPIGYILIRRTLASRTVDDSILEHVWHWSATPSQPHSSEAAEFIAAGTGSPEGTLYLDSNEHSTRIGYLSASHIDLDLRWRNSEVRIVFVCIEAISEILLAVFLFLLLTRILERVTPSADEYFLLALVIAMGTVAGWIILILSGSVPDLVQLVLRITPSSSAVHLWDALFALPTWGVHSGALIWLGLLLSSLATRVTKESTALRQTVRWGILALWCVLPAVLIGVRDFLFPIPASTVPLLSSRILEALTSIGILSLLFAYAQYSIQLLHTLSYRPAVTKAIAIAIFLLQCSGIALVSTVIWAPEVYYWGWICSIGIVAAIPFISGPRSIRWVRQRFHPVVLSVALCAFVSLGVLNHLYTDEQGQTSLQARKPLPSPTQILVEYIAATADSTTRSAAEYHTRAIDFWREYHRRTPEIGLLFVLRERISGRLLEQISTANFPLGLIPTGDTQTVAEFDDTDISVRHGEMTDSIGGMKLAQILGANRTQFQYDLILRRAVGQPVFPSVRVGSVIWDGHMAASSGITHSREPLHQFVVLLLCLSLILFLGFLLELVGRCVIDRTLRPYVSLQGRLIVLASMVLAGGSVAVFILSQEALSAHSDTAARAVFDRNVQQVRRLLLSTRRIDSLTVIDRHIASAAEQLNCDIALYDDNGVLLSTSAPEVYHYDILSPLLPSSLMTVDQHQSGLGEPVRASLLGRFPAFAEAGSIRGAGKYRTIRFLVVQRQLTFDLLRSGVSIPLVDSLILGSLLLLFVASYAATRWAIPIRGLRRAAEEIASGIPITMLPSARSDEIGDLVASFAKMNAELVSRREEVAQVEREGAWKEMARQVAHEIKNPLTPMKLSIQHVQHAFEHQDSNFPNIFRRVLRTMTEQIDVLTRIATEFARFGEMPRRRYAFVTLRTVVESAVALFDAERSHIRFAIDLPTNLSKIYADEEEFRRALVNLIKNAVQAISGWGIILISAEERSGLIHIKISDSGIGMKPDTVSKAFDPNFSTKTSGMGLGLAIVKKTITNMSGTIRVESELGKGTTFFIELPARDPNAIQG